MRRFIATKALSLSVEGKKQFAAIVQRKLILIRHEIGREVRIEARRISWVTDERK
jgi:hypothetical protein